MASTSSDVKINGHKTSAKDRRISHCQGGQLTLLAISLTPKLKTPPKNDKRG